MQKDSVHLDKPVESTDTRFGCPRISGGMCPCSAYCAEYLRTQTQPNTDGAVASPAHGAVPNEYPKISAMLASDTGGFLDPEKFPQEELARYAEKWHAELVAKFEKLSPAQHRLMAFNCASTAHSQPRTGKALHALGLVYLINRRIGRREFTDYEVPVLIHMAYCQWCEERESGIKTRSPQAT